MFMLKFWQSDARNEFIIEIIGGTKKKMSDRHAIELLETLMFQTVVQEDLQLKEQRACDTLSLSSAQCRSIPFVAFMTGTVTFTTVRTAVSICTVRLLYSSQSSTSRAWFFTTPPMSTVLIYV